MFKILLLTLTLYSSYTSAHESISVINKSDRYLTDVYTCPTKSEKKPCKLVCATPGNTAPFVKNNIDQLYIHLNVNNSINIQGKTFTTKIKEPEFNNLFYGYFTKETNCMVFGMKLTSQ